MTVIFIGAYHQILDVNMSLAVKNTLSLDILFYSDYLEEERIKELLNFHNCKLIPLNSLRWYEIRSLYKQKRIVKKLLPRVPYDLYFSQYCCNTSLIIWGCSGHSLYNLLDEGTSSIEVVANRKLSKNKIAIFFKSAVFGFCSSLYPKSVRFISKYPLSIGGTDSLVNVSIDKQKLNADTDNYAIFLGSSMVQNGLLSKEVYTRTVLSALKGLQNEKIEYVPHRFECIDWLDELGMENVKITFIETPFEQYIKNLSSLPRTIIAIAPSTALHNIGRYYSNPIQLIALTPIGNWKKKAELYKSISRTLHEMDISESN